MIQSYNTLEESWEPQKSGFGVLFSLEMAQFEMSIPEAPDSSTSLLQLMTF